MKELVNKSKGFIVRYKYFWTILLFVIIVGFVDTNSFLHLVQLNNRNADLSAQIQELEGQIKQHKQQIVELDYNPKAVEDIARRQLSMKKNDEDIYIFTSADSIGAESAGKK